MTTVNKNISNQKQNLLAPKKEKNFNAKETI
jgi:hypothetical protein